jgi:predicted neutral ceramidase superfamily lipid hydrolase
MRIENYKDAKEYQDLNFKAKSVFKKAIKVLNEEDIKKLYFIKNTELYSKFNKLSEDEQYNYILRVKKSNQTLEENIIEFENVLRKIYKNALILGGIILIFSLIFCLIVFRGFGFWSFVMNILGAPMFFSYIFYVFSVNLYARIGIDYKIAQLISFFFLIFFVVLLLFLNTI